MQNWTKVQWNVVPRLGTVRPMHNPPIAGIATRRRPAAALTLALVIGVTLAVLLSAGGSQAADAPAPLASEAARPGAKDGPTRVSMGIWVADITQIDSAAQTFSANLGVLLSWRDPRLVSSEAGIRRYNIQDIWHPNWLVANAASAPQHSFPEIAEVAADGRVRYRQRLIGTFVQPLDLRRFPFDHATFRIHFVMVGQKPSDIQFVPNEALVAEGAPTASGIAAKVTMQDWQIIDSTALVLPYPVVPGLDFAGYAFEFRARRLVQHYLVKVITPLLLIVIMSWTAFWMHPSLGSTQISIAVTSMLTLIAYRFAVGIDVPKLPYLTDLDAFILISSVLVLFTLIESIATTALTANARSDLSVKVDHYSRLLFPLAYALVIVAILLR